MCRSKSSGGRRCGAHSHESTRQAYNALRRIRYAAAKRGLSGKDTTRSGDGQNHLERLGRQWNQFEAVLTETGKKSLRDYANQDFEQINRFLYDASYRENLTQDNPDLYQRLEHHIEQLDTALACCPAADQPRVLYRSYNPRQEDVRTNPAWARQTYVPGQQVTFDAYTSTTVNSNAVLPMLLSSPRKPRGGLFDLSPKAYRKAQDETLKNTVFEIVTDRGAPVIGVAHMPQEAEVLLPRNMTFTVVGVSESVTYSTNEHLRDASPRAEADVPRASSNSLTLHYW